MTDIELAGVTTQLFKAAKARMSHSKPMDYDLLIAARKAAGVAFREADKYIAVYLRKQVKPGDDGSFLKALQSLQVSLQAALRSTARGSPLPGTETFAQLSQDACRLERGVGDPDEITLAPILIAGIVNMIDYSLLASSFAQGDVEKITITSQGTNWWWDQLPSKIRRWVDNNARGLGWSQKALPRG